MRNLIITLALLLTTQAWAETREYTLTPGLNSIAIDLEPESPEPDSVFEPILDRIELLASYDPEVGQWDHYYPDLGASGAGINTLTSIEPGQGYAVVISPGNSVSFSLVGTLPASLERVMLPGWNLVGLVNSVPSFWAYPLGADRFLCSGVAGFNGQHYGFYLPNPPFGFLGDLNENGVQDAEEFDWLYENEFGFPSLRDLIPGTAYWMRFEASVVLGPQLTLWMESDAFDPDTCEIIEDINGNGQFDYGFSVWNGNDYSVDECGRPVIATQNVVHFRVPQEAAYTDVPTLNQILTVANRGDRNGTAAYGGNDELRFHITTSEGLSDWLEVEPQAGVVSSSDPMSVHLRADIQPLSVGTHTGVLTVHSNGGTADVLIKIDVPAIEGTFEGAAIVELGQVDGCDPESTETAVLQASRPLRMTISGGTCTIQKDTAQYLEQDVVLEFTANGASFSAVGEITVGTESSFNILGQEYTRTISLTGIRASDDINTQGTLLPLQGCYEETISGLGDDITWRGPFLVLQVLE